MRIYPRALQLTRSLLGNLDDDLAPSASAAEGHQRILDPVEASKLLVRVLGAPHLALGDEVHDALPDLGDHAALVDGVGAPVDADEADVLEQDLVHGDLFDAAGGEADNEDAAVPGGALCRLVDEADGVVDNVDALLAGRQRLDLGGPVGVVVGDDVVRAKGFGDFQLARGGSRGDDGCAKGLGDLRVKENTVSFLPW